MGKILAWWKNLSLFLKLIFFVSALVVVCCVCSVPLAIIAPDRPPTPRPAAQTEEEVTQQSEDTPIPTEAPVSTDTPVPTDTPIPTDTPAPELSFADIVQHPDERGWNSTQYSTYFDTLKGQRVSWSGTILEIDKFAGENYISLGIEPGEPEIDTYVYISEQDVLKVGLGQNVTFVGIIDGSWPESNGFYSVQIKKGTLIEIGEIPTPTPAPPTPTPGPTSTPTLDIGNDIMAEVMCHDFVEDRLKSPSTADFGGLFDDRDKAAFVDAETAAQTGLDTSNLHNTGVWVVVGSVDAQNSFGAMIRSEYTCVMDYDKNTQNWYLLDISIE
jgi:hypothetical protein